MSVEDRLRIEIVLDGDTAVVRLHGELDLASAQALSARLQEAGAAGPAAIVIDLSELEFMDSTGLRSILMARERCDRIGQRFAIVPGGRQVARLLEIARVEDYLDLISSPAELAD
jgi:anti-sigma B factor antagonist